MLQTYPLRQSRQPDPPWKRAASAARTRGEEQYGFSRRGLPGNNPDQRHHEQSNAGYSPQYSYTPNGSIHLV